MTYSEAKQALNDIGRRKLEELIEQYELEAIEAAIACDVQLEDFEEAYQGQYSSDEDFARELAEQLGDIKRDVQWPYTCIDWERAARELMYDYCSDNGHYFRVL